MFSESTVIKFLQRTDVTPIYKMFDASYLFCDNKHYLSKFYKQHMSLDKSPCIDIILAQISLCDEVKALKYLTEYQQRVMTVILSEAYMGYRDTKTFEKYDLKTVFSDTYMDEVYGKQTMPPVNLYTVGTIKSKLGAGK